MTWPFENNTIALEEKLAKRNLKADKTRNVLLIITIAFASCLIMSAMLYFFAAQRASRNNAKGMYQAKLSILDEEKVRTIQKDNRVFVGCSYFMGMLDYGDYKVTVRSMDENLIHLAKYPAIIGRLPETENEVAVTQAFLNRESLSIGLGDTILLGLTGEKQSYKICGILPVFDSNYAIYVSSAFIEKNVENSLYLAYINVKGTDGMPEETIKAKIQSLAEEWGMEARNIDFSRYYFSLIRQRSFEYIAIITFIIFIVILACSMVIYSLFFASIIRKTNEYGKLRTIGTTSRQVKRIVMKEGQSLSVVAIPIGIIVGAIVVCLFVPNGWSVSMVLTVGIFDVILLYLCIMLTVRQPAKLASNITPEVRTYKGTVFSAIAPTGYEESLLVDAFPEERQAFLEKYLIAGTADWKELVQNNGVIIKQMDEWIDIFGREVSIGDRVVIQAGFGERIEATVMGIVDENIPYGGYELMFIPLETLSAFLPTKNLNYQLLIDTQENKEEPVYQEVRKLLPTNSRVYVTKLNDWVEIYQETLAKYRTPVFIFVLLIGVFGVLNLLNTLITNVLARKRELGVMQAVGMSSGQISRMLLTEGMLYILGIFVLSIIFGTVFGYLLCRVLSAMSVFGKVSYQFPIWEMGIYFALMLIVQVVFSLAAIKQLRSQTLVEQIRELA